MLLGKIQPERCEDSVLVTLSSCMTYLLPLLWQQVCNLGRLSPLRANEFEFSLGMVGKLNPTLVSVENWLRTA